MRALSSMTRRGALLQCRLQCLACVMFCSNTGIHRVGRVTYPATGSNSRLTCLLTDSPSITPLQPDPHRTVQPAEGANLHRQNAPHPLHLARSIWLDAKRLLPLFPLHLGQPLWCVAPSPVSAPGIVNPCLGSSTLKSPAAAAAAAAAATTAPATAAPASSCSAFYSLNP